MTDGLLIIDKPAGITSHDVVHRVRRALKTKRVGHTGTLDPFATGVMVILVGQATRIAQFLDKDEKEYEAIVQFGWETDTGDRTGKPVPRPGPDIPGLGPEISDRSSEAAANPEVQMPQIEARVASIDWDAVFSEFRGGMMQVPPMYSAKKVEGRKLYELAREGKEIERKAVPVTVHELEALPPGPSGIPPTALRIRVVCSAGTYIRTLAEDIGRAAGLGAHLAELRRTRAGKFDLSGAQKLEELDSAAPLIPMNDAAAHLAAFPLSDERVAKTKNGLSSRAGENFADGEAVRMIGPDGSLVAIGRYTAAEKVIQPKLVFG